MIALSLGMWGKDQIGVNLNKGTFGLRIQTTRQHHIEKAITLGSRGCWKPMSTCWKDLFVNFQMGPTSPANPTGADQNRPKNVWTSSYGLLSLASSRAH